MEFTCANTTQLDILFNKNKDNEVFDKPWGSNKFQVLFHVHVNKMKLRGNPLQSENQ